MFKVLSALVLCLGFQAHANDSGMVLVDLLGVLPGPGITKQEVKVYGRDTQKLAAVLPVTDVIGGRSVTLASEAWATEIYCQKEYVRPISGLQANDWMCTFSIMPRSQSAVDNQDIDKSVAEPSMFTRFSGPHQRRAMGIVPGGQMGTIFSAYGRQLQVLAEKLPSSLSFLSPGYYIQFDCDRSYERPNTHEVRHDYMCSLSVGARPTVNAPN